MASWWLRKCTKCPPWVSMQVLQETELWEPTLVHQIWLGLFTTVSSEMSFHSCCKVWMCRIHLWLVFNGAPPHSWEFLNNVFLEQWPAHSPAIHVYPLDFYLWAHLQSTAYATEISDVQNLEQWIQNGFEMILTTPGIFQWARKSLFRHAMFFVEAQGGHLEQFLCLSGSHNSDNMFQKAIVQEGFFTFILVYIHLSLAWTCIF